MPSNESVCNLLTTCYSVVYNLPSTALGGSQARCLRKVCYSVIVTSPAKCQAVCCEIPCKAGLSCGSPSYALHTCSITLTRFRARLTFPVHFIWPLSHKNSFFLFLSAATVPKLPGDSSMNLLKHWDPKEVFVHSIYSLWAEKASLSSLLEWGLSWQGAALQKYVFKWMKIKPALCTRRFSMGIGTAAHSQSTELQNFNKPWAS